MDSNSQPNAPPPPPPRPKTYFLTSADTPLGLHLTHHLLTNTPHNISACIPPLTTPSPPLTALLRTYPTRFITPTLSPLSPALCTSAIATTHHHFANLDILIHTSTLRTSIGALEELSAPMITTQFESLYFGRLNTIKPALPIMRRQRSGHILVLTGTTAAMGHPGMSVRCAADHAIEGLLDALAFELAPFGIKVTTIQPSIEASVWASGVDVAPPSPQYDLATLRTVRRMAGVVETGKAAGVVESAVEETVRIVAAVAGSDNPPGRITVGEEGVELVKERLKTLSEELEEYLDASLSADIVPQGSGTGRGSSAAAGQQEGGEE